jgi:hypothetical protein
MGFDFVDDEEETQSESNAPSFGDGMTTGEYKAAIRQYAQWAVEKYEVLQPVELETVKIEVSDLMERAAGKAGNDKRGRGYFMRFAWGAYQKWGWGEEVEATIRHELVHIRQFQEDGANPGHGMTFKTWADKADAPRHCKKFTEWKYLLFCTECGQQTGGRLRKSKVVTNPEDTNYISPCCRAELRSEKA